jgi:hypothetical protein
MNVSTSLSVPVCFYGCRADEMLEEVAMTGVRRLPIDGVSGPHEPGAKRGLLRARWSEAWATRHPLGTWQRDRHAHRWSNRHSQRSSLSPGRDAQASEVGTCPNARRACTFSDNSDTSCRQTTCTPEVVGPSFYDGSGANSHGRINSIARGIYAPARWTNDPVLALQVVPRALAHRISPRSCYRCVTARPRRQRKEPRNPCNLGALEALSLAVPVGFEPTVESTPTHVFET